MWPIQSANQNMTTSELGLYSARGSVERLKTNGKDQCPNAAATFYKPTRLRRVCFR